MLSHKKRYLLDGAIGMILEQRHPELVDIKLWSTKVHSKYPNELLSLYESYVKRGTNIITSNTFRTNPYLNENWFTDLKNAVDICHKIKNTNKNILIAGSNPPTEDCYSQRSSSVGLKELKENHSNHISELVKNKVDFILNETISHMDEIQIIEEYCEVNKISYGICLYCDDNLKLLDETDLFKALEYLDRNKSTEKLFIGLNCISENKFEKILNFIENEKIKFQNDFCF